MMISRPPLIFYSYADNFTLHASVQYTNRSQVYPFFVSKSMTLWSFNASKAQARSFSLKHYCNCHQVCIYFRAGLTNFLQQPYKNLKTSQHFTVNLDTHRTSLFIHSLTLPCSLSFVFRTLRLRIITYACFSLLNQSPVL